MTISNSQRTADADATRAPGTGQGAAARAHPGLALAVICAAQLMIVLDATIVNIALPTIHTSLHVAAGDLQWLLTSYALTFGGLLLLGGRAGDLYGRRRMFLAGIAVFAGASLLGGLATNADWLIGTRALQGVGAAVASPAGLSLIATTFAEGRARAKALGVYAAMSAGGGSVGLLLGGLLIDVASWRWVFFVNVPIAVAVLLLAPRVLAPTARSCARLDLPGAVTATAGMASLVYGLSNSPQHGWAAASTLAPLAAAVVLFAAFALIEVRGSAALVPLRILADRSRVGVYSLMLCLGATVLATLFFLSQYLQNVQHWSALRTGIGFLPLAAGIFVSSAATSRLVPRIGPRVPLLLGPLAFLGAMLWLSRLTAADGYLHVLGPLLLMAAGVGLEFVPITLLAVRGVAPGETGSASALVNTSQQIGGALGLSVLATVAANAAATRGHAVTAAAAADAATHGYARAFEVSAVVALAAFCVSLLVIRTPRPDGAAQR